MVIQGRSRVIIGDGSVGHVDVAISVGSPDRSRFVEIIANVDTGATFTMLPRQLLEELGIVSDRSERFKIANGEIITKQMAEVIVRLGEEESTIQCIFGEENEPAIIGVVTLEQFLLGVDTVNQRLVKIPGLLYGQAR